MLSDMTVRGRVLPGDEHHNGQHNEQPEEQQKVAPEIWGFSGYVHHDDQHNEQQRESRQQGQEEGQSHSLKQQAFSCNEGQEERQATSQYLNYQLPAGEQCATVYSVTAKSVTGIETPITFKAQQDAYRPFLLPDFQRTYHFMAGLEGLPTGRPVSLKAGSLNLSSPVAISRLRPWVTGSKLQGDCPMTVTCRLALLEGNSPILCTRRVRGYIALSFNSHQQAKQEARRLNAVVCGWNISPATRTRRANV